MDNYIKDIKPFYIYSDKGCLYIKNINEPSEKIANNISTYCANIDNFNNIHICCIDNFGKLIYLTNNNGKWNKKTIHRVFNNVKNIKDMRLYVLCNYINVFTVENYTLNDNIYKISHFNFDTKNNKFSRYNINNIYKDNNYIYKLNIDDNSNIIFEYKSLNNSNRKFINHKIIFNNLESKWLSSYKSMLRSYCDGVNIISTIRDDLFEYCYSIKYKI